MKKVNVIGVTGSGKSTFSNQLAEKLGVPYVQMDALFWKPNWQMVSREEFATKVAQVVAEDGWVLDGNYNRTNSIKWSAADTVIWIDQSYWRTLWQLFKRTITRIVSGEELWPETGNKESFRRAFLSKDSIFLWFFKCYPKMKLEYEDMISGSNEYAVKFIRLRNRRELQSFLNQVC